MKFDSFLGWHLSIDFFKGIDRNNGVPSMPSKNLRTTVYVYNAVLDKYCLLQSVDFKSEIDSRVIISFFHIDTDKYQYATTGKKKVYRYKCLF